MLTLLLNLVEFFKREMLRTWVLMNFNSKNNNPTDMELFMITHLYPKIAVLIFQVNLIVIFEAKNNLNPQYFQEDVLSP